MKFFTPSYPHYRFRPVPQVKGVVIYLTMTFEGGKTLDLAYRNTHRSWHLVCFDCSCAALEKSSYCRCGAVEQGVGLSELDAIELYQDHTARYVVDYWLSDAVGLVEAAEHTNEIVAHMRFFDSVSKAIIKHRWARAEEPELLDGNVLRLIRRASGYRDRVNRRCHFLRKYRV